jgi:hypothetical protein
MAKEEMAERKAVINIVEGTGETAGERLVKKHLPAWVVSGGLHVVIALGALLITNLMKPISATQPVDSVVSVEDKAEEPDLNDLTREDKGIDPYADNSLEKIEKEAEVNVQAKVAEVPAIGDPMQNDETKKDFLNTLGKPGDNLADPGTTNDGGNLGGPLGGSRTGGPSMSPVLAGRGDPATRNKLLNDFGGLPESERAVAWGLIWLARQQQRDGNWEFDGTSKDMVAATGLSILPFLAAGQTHQKSRNPKDNKYVDKVALGINWLLKQQRPDGSFKGSSGMYSHAIATIALCECYGMTSDKSLLRNPAQSAINFIQNAQGPDGSWGYQAKANGDTSIVGWQIQALQSGKLCKDITVDKNVLKKAMDFLDKVASGSLKATYGYTSPGASKTLTPVGLLCRYYIDGWGPQNPSYQAGVEFIMKQQMPSDAGDFNMYYYYYATQVLHFNEGDQWYKEWNPRMRDLLIKRQHGDKAPLAVAGSWDADKGISGTHWGRLGSTCMSLLTLEVYYRHTPLHRRDAGGLKEIERGK